MYIFEADAKIPSGEYIAVASALRAIAICDRIIANCDNGYFVLL